MSLNCPQYNCDLYLSIVQSWFVLVHSTTMSFNCPRYNYDLYLATVQLYLAVKMYKSVQIHVESTITIWLLISMWLKYSFISPNISSYLQILIHVSKYLSTLKEYLFVFVNNFVFHLVVSLFLKCTSLCTFRSMCCCRYFIYIAPYA